MQLKRRKPFRIGLTGSVGMGKSTTAAMFEEQGAAVWDADKVVHRLYGRGEAGSRALAELVPGAIVDGGVDRARLRHMIKQDRSLLPRIEELIHPLVAGDRAKFAETEEADVHVFDIPLLFETGQQDMYDMVVLVTAPPEIQRQRVLERPGMTEDALDDILARQMPDAKKRRLADRIIDTSEGLDAARSRVAEIMREIEGMPDA